MAIEYLNSAADFAHLDGALVYPLFVDDSHVLVTEDGITLLLPVGMRVSYPGRFGIDGSSGMPFVDTLVSGEDALRLARWGEGLQSRHLLDQIRAHITQVLATSPNPEKYIHREDI